MFNIFIYVCIWTDLIITLVRSFQKLMFPVYALPCLSSRTVPKAPLLLFYCRIPLPVSATKAAFLPAVISTLGGQGRCHHSGFIVGRIPCFPMNYVVLRVGRSMFIIPHSPSEIRLIFSFESNAMWDIGLYSDSILPVYSGTFPDSF